MSLTISQSDGVQLAHYVGDLNEEGQLADLFQAVSGGGVRLVLDLSRVALLTSAGIGELVRLVAHANTQEARVVLAAPAAFVANILEVTHLDRFFVIHPTVAAAVSALRG